MSIKNKWVIIYNNYEGLEKTAVDRMCGMLSGRTVSAVTLLSACDKRVNTELLAENNLVFIGTKEGKFLSDFISEDYIKAPKNSEGYSVSVKKSCYSENHTVIAVCGYDSRGVLYGVIDFYNYYMGTEMYRTSDAVVTQNKYYDIPIVQNTPEYEHISSPSLKKRGIWTWGHCIYDYRKFFENMLSLRLNQIVIWNDFPPLNAKEVVDFAHTLGIEVFWGFSWGWDTKFDNYESGRKIDDENLISEWSEKVFKLYRDSYADTGADGIYFQSFTEMHRDTLGGVNIAEAVVKWVNTIGNKLLGSYPELEIQFGLHATSVNTHLDKISGVDSRIHIVWEDCGAFPYNYNPEEISNFDETLEFNGKICKLRGENERFGAVLKGMTKLDWSIFEHQGGEFVMGTYDDRFISERTAMKMKVWRNLQSYWLENAEYASKMIENIAKSTNGEATVQMLVEDGCFENGIFFPVALAAELMWESGGNILRKIGQTARIPNVRFANF